MNSLIRRSEKPEPFSVKELHTLLCNRLTKKCEPAECCFAFDVCNSVFVVALKLFNGQGCLLTSNNDWVLLDGNPYAVKIYQNMILVATTEETSFYNINLDKKICALPHDHTEIKAVNINHNVLVACGDGDMYYYDLPSALGVLNKKPNILDLEDMEQQPAAYPFFRQIDCQNLDPITGAIFCAGKFIVSACDDPGLSIDGKLQDQFHDIHCMCTDPDGNSFWIVQDLVISKYHVVSMECTRKFNFLPAIQKIVNKKEEFFNPVYVHVTKNQILLAVEHNHDFASEPQTILLRCNLKTNQITTCEILRKVESFCVRNETLFFVTKRLQNFSFF